MNIASFRRLQVQAILSIAMLFGSALAPFQVLKAQDESDRAAIADQIGKLVSALRAGDADLYTSVYLEDADYINNGSPHMRGSAAVRSELEQLIAAEGAFTDLDLPITSIRFLEDDVAIVDCFVTSSSSRATYYMVKRQDSWRIASARILQPVQD